MIRRILISLTLVSHHRQRSGHVADNVTCAWTAKPQDHRRDFLRFAGSANGSALCDFGIHSLVPLEDIAANLRVDEARIYHIDAKPRFTYSSAAILVSPIAPCLDAM